MLKLLKLNSPRSGDTSAARAKLRAAHAQRSRAKDQLAKAQQRAEDLRSVIASVNDAEAEVARLDEAITQDARDWVAAGQDPTKAPPAERRLKAELVEAQNLVADRRIRADAAQAAFGAEIFDNYLGRSTIKDITPDEVAAQDALGSAEGAAKDAVRDLMLATIEPRLVRLQILQADYKQEFREARALVTALSGNNHSYSSDYGALEQRLRALSISCVLASDYAYYTAERREINGESGEWCDFGNALARDPDAPAPSA